MDEFGFTCSGLFACEGVIAAVEEKVNELEGEAWEAWLQLNYELANDASLPGAADHLLYVGRKDQ
jgi:hypothetical protein